MSDRLDEIAARLYTLDLSTAASWIESQEERISELESTLAAIIEANDKGWGEEFIRAIDDAKLLLEPPR